MIHHPYIKKVTWEPAARTIYVDDTPVNRAATSCPACGDAKRPGLLVCWPCFRIMKEHS